MMANTSCGRCGKNLDNCDCGHHRIDRRYLQENTLHGELHRQQDICGPRKDYRNADFARWARMALELLERAEKAESRMKELMEAVTEFMEDHAASEAEAAKALDDFVKECLLKVQGKSSNG